MDTSTMSQSSSDPFEQAIGIVCARHLHQVFWLPENELHGKLRVTYGTTSNFSDKGLPVVLICPPMFGGRWMLLHFDHLAKSMGVRVVCFDRPSMGGSTPVPLQDRIKVWLETVPALLKHLDIEYVSLLSHSAGTMYCLNTLYYLRDILHPEHPYTAMIAPWVHNEHSKKTLLTLASKIPVSIMDSWHTVMKFVATRIQPAVAWSGGITANVSGIFGPGRDDSGSDLAALAEKFGTSESVAIEIERLGMKYFFAEDPKGGTEEAKLCLKKGGPGSWMICEDFKNYVHDFTAKEEESSNTNTAHQNVKVRVFYAESDMLIGEGGKAYFEECWRVPDVQERVDFESQTLPGTDHETALVDLEVGAVPDIFEEIKSLS